MANMIQALQIPSVDVPTEHFKNLIRDSEQLRILKNYCKLEEVITKSDILTLIKAMEVSYE